MRTDMARRPPLSERIRLIRILRTHGLRAVERLRADELKVALDKLGLTLPEEGTPAYGVAPLEPLPSSESSSSSAPSSAAPSSPSLQQRGDEVAPDAEEITAEHAIDPMDARFREPAAFVPAGERTFLRLVAVDWQHLFATWDTDAHARARLGGDDALLRVRVADSSLDEPGDVLFHEHVKISARGWYLRAPEQRLRVVAALTTPSGEVLCVSNATIVPPNHPAPPGPLRFASVPVGVDRSRLRGGLLLRALIDDETDLPEGVVVAESGRQVRARAASEQGDSAPSSGKRRLLSQGGPTLPSTSASSSSGSAPSSSAPSSSAPSSWRSAPSSSGAQR